MQQVTSSHHGLPRTGTRRRSMRSRSRHEGVVRGRISLRWFLVGLAMGILFPSISRIYALAGTATFTGTSQELTGDITAARIVDAANSAYFIDPAASGTSLSLAGAASISGSLTLPQGAAMRPAFGPTTLSYKSGLDAWTTGLIIQDGTGNVGIGTTGPGSTLDVKGTLRLSGATSGFVGLAPAAVAGSVTYTLPSADGTSGQVLSTNASGVLSWATAGGGTPVGGIIMYSGAWNFDGTGLGTGALAGWALANGNNGTPDLSDRFVMGTTSSPTPGGTGGASTYSLSAGQLPSHTHSIGTDGSHNHTLWQGGAAGSGGLNPSGGGATWNTNYITSSGAHAHGGATGGAGSGASIDNRPSFLQLAFIMKL